MLDDTDIQKLIEAFATRDEVATKVDVEDIKHSFSDLQSSVDRFAKKADAYFQEMVMLSHGVNRMEDWIHKSPPSWK